MNVKKLGLLALLAIGSISLASCGSKNNNGSNENGGNTTEKATATIRVTNGSGTGVYNVGDTITVNASVKAGMTFKEWQINGQMVSTSPSYTFTVTGDATLVATYVNNTVNVTVEGGSGSGIYTIGTEVTVVASVPQGKEFANWTINGQEVSTNLTYSFLASEDVTVVANYLEIKAVITVTGGTGGGTFTVGTEVSVVANVPEGKEFVNWTIDGKQVSIKASYTFTVSEDVTLVANFQDVPTNVMARYTKTVTMKDDDFKILNLTDIQLHDGDDYELNEHIITQTVEKTQPDFIAVLGDTINDDTTYGTVEMPKKIVELIDSFDIPWAPIFGNHDYADYGPQGSKKTGGVAMLEGLFAECDNCLYVHGPSDVRGSSNYIVNIVKEGSGDLVESLIFLDSHHAGLDATNTIFYEDAVNYIKELNDDVAPRSIVFEHVPIPEYGTVFNEAEAEEMHNISGIPFRDPITGTDTSLFPKIKELGSTKAVISGHDHELAFVADYQGVNLVYALKSSLGNDPDGNSFSHPFGGLTITLDGENEEQFDYTKVTDLPYEVVSGKDFPYFPEILQYWRYSGAKLKFDIELPSSGKVNFNIQGTNFRRDVSDDLRSGNWNRLSENVTIDAANKTVNYGSLTLVNDNKYQYELDLTEVPLNAGANEKAYGDETARLVYFPSANVNFKVNNIRFEKEEIPVTDQIDLSNAVISPIEDQMYMKGRVIRPEVEVKLDGEPLKLVDDILIKYSNEKEIGTATVEVVPSGKGAARYKGSKTTTFNIVGNPWRGDAFEPGFTRNFNDTPLSETISFDVHFTSASTSTMYFMIGDGWDEYFGYYGLKADGTLVEDYSGVSVKTTADEYVRVTCVLNKMNKKNGSNLNPTEKVNLFYVHGNWGNNPTGYIDFDLEEAPETVRGEAFSSGVDKSISCNFNYGDTFIVDFKFTSGAGTHLNFFIGNTKDNWGYYFGYYKLTQAGELGGNYEGIALTTTSDGYYRLTITISDLNLPSAKGAPSEQDGFNLFYIHGGWTTGSGYVDFNPSI